MFSKITEGLTHRVEKLVGPNDSATKYGSGMVEVFATPAMIALMEKTALECVNHLLPDGHTTVGTEIKVKHTKATAIGKKVKCEVQIIEVDRKKLVFKVEAFDEQGSIGIGTHTRFIINEVDFMAKLI
jgi:fluoroacetyl-CoA thioesterase